MTCLLRTDWISAVAALKTECAVSEVSIYFLQADACESCTILRPSPSEEGAAEQAASSQAGLSQNGRAGKGKQKVIIGQHPSGSHSHIVIENSLRKRSILIMFCPAVG